MKRFVLAVIALLFVVSFTGNSIAGNWTGKLGLMPSTGALFPTNGQFDSYRNLSDVVDMGPNLGFSLRYGITPHFALEGAFSYSWMYVDDALKPNASADPAYVMPNFTLNGIYKVIPDNRFSPYVTIGGGLYPWKFSEDGPTGDAVSAPEAPSEEFSKTSFGLNAGAGLEVFLFNNFSVFGQGKYYYVFSEDEEKFGPFFENQGFLSIDFGFTYYLPLRSGK